jgi:hypothetical protein
MESMAITNKQQAFKNYVILVCAKPNTLICEEVKILQRSYPRRVCSGPMTEEE